VVKQLVCQHGIGAVGWVRDRDRGRAAERVERLGSTPVSAGQAGGTGAKAVDLDGN
jgi:hypothetical protein